MLDYTEGGITICDDNTGPEPEKAKANAKDRISYWKVTI